MSRVGTDLGGEEEGDAMGTVDTLIVREEVHLSCRRPIVEITIDDLLAAMHL